jgi:hypothetical protein
MIGSVGILAVYLVVAAACLSVSRQYDVRRDQSRSFWRTAALLLVVTGVASSLGLTEIVADGVRGWLRHRGLYAERNDLQVALIGGCVIVAILVALGWAATRGGSSMVGLAAGLMLVSLMLFVAVRSVSLHRVDAVLFERIGPISAGRAGELALLAGIGAMAALNLRRRPAGRRGRRV